MGLFCRYWHTCAVAAAVILIYTHVRDSIFSEGAEGFMHESGLTKSYSTANMQLATLIFM